jgi:hypothetical protein
VRTTPDNQKLMDLIGYARHGKVVLPQFQRNFVWSRDDITALLTSILEGHFIGTFLLLSTDKDSIPFAIRALQGIGLSENQLKPDYMVLDGQQRLTSLNYVFTAPDIPLRYTKYPYRFFLDLKKITEKDLENAVISERSDYTDGMMNRENQFENLIIPFTEVEKWDDWLYSYERWLFELDKELYFEQYFKIDKPAWNIILERIRNYLVPTITIPKIIPNNPNSLAEVCAIFEKMNSTGVRLSVYDLLTARMYKYGIDIHSLWEKTVTENGLINLYSNGNSDSYGVYLLRTIALMRGLDVKSKTLINLEPQNFKKDWRTAARYMQNALKRITSYSSDGFGAFDPRWLPYSTMVSPLAAMLYQIESKKLDHNAYKLMKRWYWSSIFRERYAGAVESTIYRDYQDFNKAIRDTSIEPEAIHDARINIVENQAFSLLGISRLNSIYRGVMCLVALRGAVDFQADDSIQFHTLEDHHVFPVAYLRKQKKHDGKPVPPDRINCVINRTLISAQTNRLISRKSPKEYLEKVVPAERIKDIMQSHFINSGALTAMRNNDFDAYEREREKVIVSEIRKMIVG